MVVSFLFTRIIYHDGDDYKKLARVIKYAQDTIFMPLILSIDKSENIKWYIDAVFLVHKYMMIHTGGFMTVVTDWDYVQSIQKKMDTNSSNEDDFVRVDYVLAQVIWTW